MSPELQRQVADLLSAMARNLRPGRIQPIWDMTVEIPWLASELRGRGLEVVDPTKLAAVCSPAVLATDPPGIVALASEGAPRLTRLLGPLAAGGWLVVIGSASEGEAEALRAGLEVLPPPADSLIRERLRRFEVLTFSLAGAGGPQAALSRSRLLIWSSPEWTGPSLESILLVSGEPSDRGRVIVSREFSVVAGSDGKVPTSRAQLAVADVLDEVAALRRELDRGLYRAARRGRDVLARVPYGLPAAKALLHGAIRTRQFVNARRSGRRSVLPVGLDPPGTSYPAKDRWLDFQAPEVSIVILNWNRGLLTLAALQHVWRNTSGAAYEVMVVDNGSLPGDLKLAHRFRTDFRVVRIGVNRYFGEGNNIGAEEAHGRLLIFLNNDALPQPGWLEPLLWAMRQPQVGAAGARLLFPDGRIQESGALMHPDGTPLQLEKGMPFDQGTQEALRPVDYCSAAALCIRKQDFIDFGGFDLTWEPAYYEDADLCMKVRQAGSSVVCATESHVVHLEHATTSRPGRGLDLRGQPEFNQPKFVERWGPMLRADQEGKERPAIAALAPPRVPAGGDGRHHSVGVFTPYQMAPGGGERYVLTLAAVLSGNGPCTFLFPDRYSAIRVRQVARELGVWIAGEISTGVWDPGGGVQDFDYFVALGNEVTPPVSGLGRFNIYMCQFPFPAPSSMLRERGPLADTYDEVFVNSEFSAVAFSAANASLKRRPQVAKVVHPPCGTPEHVLTPLETSTIRIVSVGRFFRGGHTKRHDVLIKAFREVVGSHPHGRNLELHLVGTAMQQWDSRAYLAELADLARGVSVEFHVNAPGPLVRRLLSTSHIYWHGAGFGVDERRHPERLEHFGIAIVEAMGGGCIPVAYGAGGPLEIITAGENGRLYRSRPELVETTRELIAAIATGSDAYQAMRRAAWERARQFSDERFAARVLGLLSEHAQG